MIGYVTLGTNDMARACGFYDALLGELGAKRIMEGERFVAWGTGPQSPSLGVIKPFDGKDLVALITRAVQLSSPSRGGADGDEDRAPGDDRLLHELEGQAPTHAQHVSGERKQAV